MRHLILVLLLAGCSVANSETIPYFPSAAPMVCTSMSCTADEPQAVSVDKNETKYSLRMRYSCDAQGCSFRTVAPAYCTSKGCEVTVAALTPSDRSPSQFAEPCGGQCPKGCPDTSMDSVCKIAF